MASRGPARHAGVRDGRDARPFLSLVLFFLLVAGAVPSLALDAAASRAAHEEPGSIHGVAVDPSGKRVPHARLVLATAVGVVVTSEADEAGAFGFPAVPAGRYELRVFSRGLVAEPLIVEVEPGRALEVTLSLRLSAVTESVVVSAAHVELPLARAATSIAVLAGDGMEARQVETVADALRTVPGFAVARNGGRGAVTSVFPRGGESDFTLVLVDGVKVNAFGGGFDFSTLYAAGVERVEVVRGPESALFGSEAIAGVVHVITRSGGRPQASGAVERGSLGTSRVSAAASGSLGAWSWGASGGRTASGGFRGIAPATGERVANDDFRQLEAGGNAGWRAAFGGDLRLSVRAGSHERGYPGPFGSNPIGAYTGIDLLSRGTTGNRQAAVRWQQPLGGAGGRSSLVASASQVQLKNDFTSAYGLSAAGTRRFEGRVAVNVDVSDAVAFSAGGTWQAERATSSFIAGDGEGLLPIRRRDTAGFAELRVQALRSVSLTAGVRAARVRREAMPANDDPYSPRPAFDPRADHSINPRVSAAWSLPGGPGSRLSWTRLRAAAGTGMRAPDALEIAFTDNPHLKPERSWSVEAGFDQAWLGDRIVVGLVGFVNRYEDLIVSVGPVLRHASRYRTDNISNARARGLETSLALRTGWGLEASATHTWLSTAILAVDRLGAAPPPFTPGDPLLRRPRRQGSLDLLFTRGGVTAFARLTGRGRVLDVEPSWGSYGGLFSSPGYSVLDAGASVRVHRHVTLLARAGNVLDRRYEEAFGFPALGRTATIGVRLAAGR
ncbi:MAG TPA: TonB-dependent receptor [Vicinamibacterales bacterium]|nr:TonB-dependent receptor [Vicinamibacterales bacterium]